MIKRSRGISVESTCSNRRVEGRTTHPQISTSVTFSDSSEVIKELIPESRLPSSGVDVEDLSTSGFVGEREVELSVESSRSTKSWVDGVGSVGGSDNDHLTCGRGRSRKGTSELHRREREEVEGEKRPTSTVHSIHESEKSRDDRSMDLILFTASDGSET